jgi:hypothetical protein
MQAFAVVVALLAVAALGWALSWGARRILRRHGVPTDERSVRDPAAPGSAEGEPAGRDRVGRPTDEGGAGD